MKNVDYGIQFSYTEAVNSIKNGWPMTYLKRLIEKTLSHTLTRGKSILLLGARQTGKTTLIKHQIQADLTLSFANLETQFSYEKQPKLLAQEILALYATTQKKPLIVIDEIQKIPMIMDAVQDLIDNQKAQFILTGSSARKLKHYSKRNLLPGRIIRLQLDALSLDEMPVIPDLESLLLYGSLPEIFLEKEAEDKAADLRSYVISYLQEEIRAEAVVRNLSAFSRFLECAAMEAGQLINFSKLSQEVGITRNTLYDYYQILEDCLIVDRIEPLIENHTRRRLSKAPKFIFFDMGIVRACAGLGTHLSKETSGRLFEQFIGIEILRWIRLTNESFRLFYWRDHSGPEIDFVLDKHHCYLPIEVKWTNRPTEQDCRSIEKFMAEYPCFQYGYIVCQVQRAALLTPHIMAIPWQSLTEYLNKLSFT